MASILDGLDPKTDVVTVIAAGASAKGLPFDRLPGLKIGVNDAGLLACCDVIVSMDRLWAENRWVELTVLQREAWIRRSALQNITWDEHPAWLHKFECDHTGTEPARDAGRLNGTNSGMCGVNRALQLKPKLVVLVGFDMGRIDSKAYWHAPYSWGTKNGNTSNGKYAIWARQFGPLANAFKNDGIRVVNASLVSAIPDWPKVDPQEVLL